MNSSLCYTKMIFHSILSFNFRRNSCMLKENNKIEHLLDFDVKPNLALTICYRSDIFFWFTDDFGLVGTSNTESSESFKIEN